MMPGEDVIETEPLETPGIVPGEEIGTPRSARSGRSVTVPHTGLFLVWGSLFCRRGAAGGL